jgi:curved DNA-binding protein CbpA
VQEMMDESAGERPEGFAYITRGKALSEDQDEYFRILIRFGLSPKASLGELKATYRKRVKKVHPDTAGGSAPGAKAEFMDLTQAYERAVELRSRLGLPNE